ncbi:four-carbon acid sugar kinase family protein, partial [Streptomyces sp. MCAF7]
MTLRIGCVADDFTGGTDVAAAFRRAGLRTALVFGVPGVTTALPADCDAAVVALKSRSVPADEAVLGSTTAQRWLWAMGAAQIYFKYALTAHQQAGARHIVADALTDDDLAVLGAAALELPVVAGAAGLAEGLGRAYPATGPASSAPVPYQGRAAVLAGSCSARTLEQIARFRAAGLPSRYLDVLAAAGRDITGEALDWYDAQDPEPPVLIHASASPEELAAVQAELGVAEAAAQAEELLGTLAAHLVERGVRRLLVAGGETSGAVTTALGIRAV